MFTAAASSGVTAVLGISIETQEQITQQLSTLQSAVVPRNAPAPDAARLAEQIVRHMFNYVSGFVNGGAVTPESAVPMSVIARHFTWVWYAVVMGTGAISALLHNFPYNNESLILKRMAVAFFILNLVIFTFAIVCTILRYKRYPEIWAKMIRHSAYSLYIACFPMGIITLLDSALAINQDGGFGGRPMLYTLWVLWLFDVALSYAIVFGMMYTMIVKQSHALARMTAVWLLPVVTLIVASSAGGLFATALQAHSHTLALLTSGFSLSMLLIGLSFATMMITIYLLRLIIHGPPDVDMILSVFLVLGPLGQGGFSFLINGQLLSELLPVHVETDFPQSPLAGQMIFSGIDEEEEADVVEGLSPHTPPSRGRGHRPGHIDLSKLDSAFKRWTESIAQKVKRKKKQEDHSFKEIYRSVFEPTVAPVPSEPGLIKTLDHNPPLTRDDYATLVRQVQEAIGEGIHPKMISKGSSGSYFARAKREGRVQTVAVFKPKDEEPYGNLNPKTTKWLHRQFRWIIPFGRACLIPNLSYISEAAASLLDERLDLNIVPRTELVSLSSPAFYYDWLDRNAAKKGKPLPDKIGSMQYFLHGFTDASEFLRKHPWPGRAISDTFDDSSHRRGGLTKKYTSILKIVCGKTGDEEDMYDDDDREDEQVLFDVSENNQTEVPFYWSSALQDNFREELEKCVFLISTSTSTYRTIPRLVILDYLMLNTDRGADNYMIKYCKGSHDERASTYSDCQWHPVNGTGTVELF
ncbi:hypothetical protein EUX98_g6339 [Antrodiella citrinella]|uniref:Phosphatidylinositol 4-kinase n=1 Tax=Antrodiella citrinella TaxID=2447956 RepID=A0A4S4MQ26_9APHY|nr:hypothetical protein EUX98_g6339 [Antrodiella citrinella]